VSVVGADLGESPLSLERALLALAAEGVHVIGFSASGSRLRLVVEETDTAQAARILHRAFVEPAPPALS
jgi:aspartokinase